MINRSFSGTANWPTPAGRGSLPSNRTGDFHRITPVDQVQLANQVRLAEWAPAASRALVSCT